MVTVAPSYLFSLTEHVNECERDLFLLKEKMLLQPWSRFEELAAERSLQLLIEAAIGVAKHWAKAVSGQTVNEGLKAFQYLESAGLIESNQPWKKVIGLRNALVHDYLDVDPEIIQSVIQQGYYQQPLNFVRQAVAALSTQNP
ncbi:type VII toxin-antitoxin system HepT family RNase toxin [Marinospirillum alkaliphilum]|uniref:Uncharacterized conserved protein YutE, UPF0331/DUF86 family n=1 Tax=Marinospirillum alkaliphilum DSM 21637 TaxID=1122209 RepID=A0A1K1ZP66_9GAMM|nr:DUF86 domain-containing protein [Marinospirillum alkaliphilum]SFX75903.1 Uncharacterized conserved protein YutE, UPF0331/DUF86 family [Marinospirillum alkaliphilum DSM 21637]